MPCKGREGRLVSSRDDCHGVLGQGCRIWPLFDLGRFWKPKVCKLMDQDEKAMAPDVLDARRGYTIASYHLDEGASHRVG